MSQDFQLEPDHLTSAAVQTIAKVYARTEVDSNAVDDFRRTLRDGRRDTWLDFLADQSSRGVGDRSLSESARQQLHATLESAISHFERPSRQAILNLPAGPQEPLRPGPGQGGGAPPPPASRVQRLRAWLARALPGWRYLKTEVDPRPIVAVTSLALGVLLLILVVFQAPTFANDFISDQAKQREDQSRQEIDAIRTFMESEESRTMSNDLRGISDLATQTSAVVQRLSDQVNELSRMRADAQEKGQNLEDCQARLTEALKKFGNESTMQETLTSYDASHQELRTNLDAVLSKLSSTALDDDAKKKLIGELEKLPNQVYRTKGYSEAWSGHQGNHALRSTAEAAKDLRASVKALQDGLKAWSSGQVTDSNQPNTPSGPGKWAVFENIDSLLKANSGNVFDTSNLITTQREAFQRSQEALASLNQTAARLDGITKLQYDYFSSAAAPAMIALLLVGGLFSTVGLTALIKWTKTQDSLEAERRWKQGVSFCSRLGVELYCQGYDVRDFLQRLHENPLVRAGTDSVKANLPSKASLTELTTLVKELRSSAR